METSASFEARPAPSSSPAPAGSRLQLGGKQEQQWEHHQNDNLSASCSVLGSPTAVICSKLGSGLAGYAPGPKVPFNVTPLRWLSRLKPSAIPSSRRPSLR